MASIYTRLVLNLFFIIGVYGLLLPWMISQPDDILVIGGLVLGALVGPLVVYAINKQFVVKILEKNK